MVPSLELSIVVWLRYNLKLHWTISESDIKKGHSFHIFLLIFHKNFKILVLSYNLSHFVPVFKMTDEKIGQI